jgi:hypothetical protein
MKFLKTELSLYLVKQIVLEMWDQMKTASFSSLFLTGRSQKILCVMYQILHKLLNGQT